MLDTIEEQMKQDDETTAATQLVKMLAECGFKISAHGRESQEDTGWTLTMPLYATGIDTSCGC